MHKIRTLLADDTLIAREGWKKILETEEDIEIIAEALNAQEVPEKVATLRPDILLMDLKWFQDANAGAITIEQIKNQVPETKVIAITAYSDLIADARKAGADAALPKGFSKRELVDLIKAVHSLQRTGKPTRRGSPAQLAAAILIPAVGFVIIAVALMWGIRSLSITKFLAAIIPSMIAYFFVVVFAGRYVDIISETATYKLFLRILNLFRIKLPKLPFHNGQ